MLLCNALLGVEKKQWLEKSCDGLSALFVDSALYACSMYVFEFQLICIYYTQNVIHFSPIFTSLIPVIYLFTQHITIETFTPCLVDLCKALWGVLKSYYKTMKWHETNDKDTATQSPEPGI